jgi:hypothetical protein
MKYAIGGKIFFLILLVNYGIITDGFHINLIPTTLYKYLINTFAMIMTGGGGNRSIIWVMSIMSIPLSIRRISKVEFSSTTDRRSVLGDSCHFSHH